MATILFNIFFSLIFHEMKKKIGDVGIEMEADFRLNPAENHRKINKEKKDGERIVSFKIWSLLFADDAAFSATTEEELQLITRVFDETCKKFGLTVSVPKTKVLVQLDKRTQKQNVTTLPSTCIEVGNVALEEVQKFKYLGVMISAEASWTQELNHRISLSWVQFIKQIKTIYQREGLSLKNRIWMFKTYITTKLLYGCEAWAPTTEEFRKLETLQRKMLMMILGIYTMDKVRYVDMLEKTNMVCVESYIRRQRLIWAGNMVRMKDDRIPKLMLFGTLKTGNRSKGKPKHTLRDALSDDLNYFNICNNSWRELASIGRHTWLQVVDSGCEYFITNWKNRKPEALIRKIFTELPFQKVYTESEFQKLFPTKLKAPLDCGISF